MKGPPNLGNAPGAFQRVPADRVQHDGPRRGASSLESGRPGSRSPSAAPEVISHRRLQRAASDRVASALSGMLRMMWAIPLTPLDAATRSGAASASPAVNREAPSRTRSLSRNSPGMCDRAGKPPRLASQPGVVNRKVSVVRNVPTASPLPTAEPSGQTGATRDEQPCGNLDHAQQRGECPLAHDPVCPAHQRTVRHHGPDALGLVGREFHPADPQQHDHQTVAGNVGTGSLQYVTHRLTIEPPEFSRNHASSLRG